MSKFFINRPIVAMVIAIFFVIAGAVMVFRLPVAQFPDIVPPKIQTTAIYTGADALTVEQSVATPIEEQVNGAKNMIYMQSINGDDGTMTLQVSFEVGTDVDLDQVQVQNRLSQAPSSLPTAVNNYGLTTQQTVGIPLLVFAITSPHRTWDQTFLANYIAINIEDELARIPGIGQVKIFGAANYAMRVWVAPDTLAKLQLTVNDIVNAIVGPERRESRGHHRRRAGAAGPATHLHRARAGPPDERRGVRQHHPARQPRRLAGAAQGRRADPARRRKLHPAGVHQWRAELAAAAVSEPGLQRARGRQSRQGEDGRARPAISRAT